MWCIPSVLTHAPKYSLEHTVYSLYVKVYLCVQVCAFTHTAGGWLSCLLRPFEILGNRMMTTYIIKWPPQKRLKCLLTQNGIETGNQ